MLSRDAMNKCVSATLAGSSPRAQRNNGCRSRAGNDSNGGSSKSRGSRIGIHSPEDTTPIPTIHRTPFVLVGLLATQKMEFSRALLQRLAHGMVEQDDARALKLIGRVKPRNIAVGTVAMLEAVVDGDAIAGGPQLKEPNYSCAHQLRNGVAMKLSNAWVRHNSGLAAALPPGPMQTDQGLQHRWCGILVGSHDFNRSAACRAIASRAHGPPLVTRNNAGETVDAFGKPQNRTRAGVPDGFFAAGRNAEFKR